MFKIKDKNATHFISTEGIRLIGVVSNREFDPRTGAPTGVILPGCQLVVRYCKDLSENVIFNFETREEAESIMLTIAEICGYRGEGRVIQ